jgi:hypothetical protein
VWVDVEVLAHRWPSSAPEASLGGVYQTKLLAGAEIVTQALMHGAQLINLQKGMFGR